MKRIKHNDLTHYFIRDHKTLPKAYLKICNEFFNSLPLNVKSDIKGVIKLKYPLEYKYKL